jgi:hypothetical protein
MQIVTRTVAFGAMLSVLALTFAANAGEMTLPGPKRGQMGMRHRCPRSFH